jgi:5'-3' exonuclease
MTQASEDIVLIDLSSILHPIWHQCSAEPNPNATRDRTIARVRALAAGQSHVAICIDSPKSFRKAIDPTYKAQRERNEPLQHQMRLTIETLRGDGFPMWGADGYEADDVIASGVMAALNTKNGRRPRRVLIVSGDKDLFQLLQNGDEDTPAIVMKWVPTGAIVEAPMVKANPKYGVTPGQMCDWLTMVGDASDNVKGIPGVGEKTAAAFLNEFGSLEAIYAAIDAGATPKLTALQRTKFQEFRTQWPVTRSLIQLRTDVAILFDEVFKVRAPQNDIEMFGDWTTLGGDAVNTETGEVKEPAQERDTASAPPAGSVVAVNGTTKPEAALVVRQPEVLPPAEYARQLEPRSLGDAYKLATSMHQARLFSAYGNADAVLSTILAGREFGMPAMASLRAFHVIDGKPTLAADTIRALVLQSGAAEYFRCTERTPTRATFATKRKGEPNEIALSYTLEEGRVAFNGDEKKFASSGWGRNSADMCVARAGAKLARLVYPDVLHSVYAREEFD